MYGALAVVGTRALKALREEMPLVCGGTYESMFKNS